MAEWVIGLIRKAQGGTGCGSASGGSNVGGLTEEAERAKGLSSLLTGASAQGEGTPDAKLWGTRQWGGVCFFI